MRAVAEDLRVDVAPVLATAQTKRGAYCMRNEDCYT